MLRLAVLLIALTCSLPALAFELGPRRVDASGAIDTKAGVKIANDLIKLDGDAAAPIYLLVTATSGTAQGVTAVVDTLQALKSPVVAVVMTPVQGAGAALAVLTDRLVMLPNASLIFTEVDYEGVAKPAPTPAATATTPAPSAAETFMREVRRDYLGRFWARVGRRLNAKGDLQAELERLGGKMFTASDALKAKVAFEVVETLTVPPANVERTELKVTTVRTQNKTAKPMKDLGVN